MKLIKATIAAAALGLSVNALAAVNDINDVTHGSISSKELRVGGAQPKWSDISAVTKPAGQEVRPLTKSAGNYRFSDINSVTHN
ncbi:MAG: hypothetical protein AMJ66_00500 [Betaproteobacteria bacterium SG8_40]|jgi:hypothetical protein|nr:MAG: hypothetical protein AMJ66_00500 [Betaproteobacteria bacterium SG8_40]